MATKNEVHLDRRESSIWVIFFFNPSLHKNNVNPTPLAEKTVLKMISDEWALFSGEKPYFRATNNTADTRWSCTGQRWSMLNDSIVYSAHSEKFCPDQLWKSAIQPCFALRLQPGGGGGGYTNRMSSKVCSSIFDISIFGSEFVLCYLY